MNCEQILTAPVLRPNATLEEFKKYQSDLAYFLKYQGECGGVEWRDTDANRYASTIPTYAAVEKKDNTLYYILGGLALIMIFIYTNK